MDDLEDYEEYEMTPRSQNGNYLNYDDLNDLDKEIAREDYEHDYESEEYDTIENEEYDTIVNPRGHIFMSDLDKEIAKESMNVMLPRSSSGIEHYNAQPDEDYNKKADEYDYDSAKYYSNSNLNMNGMIPRSNSIKDNYIVVDDDFVLDYDTFSVECQNLAKDAHSCMLSNELSLSPKCVELKEELKDEFGCSQVSLACKLFSCYGTCAEIAKTFLNCEANASGCNETCNKESGTILTPSPTIHPSEPPSRSPSLRPSSNAQSGCVTNSDCSNRGTCMKDTVGAISYANDGGGSFCDCDDNYYGLTCSNYCPIECKNGKCENDGNDNYKCNCYDNWGGPTCDISIAKCPDGTQCLNGKRCVKIDYDDKSDEPKDLYECETVKCPEVSDTGCSICGPGMCIMDEDAVFSFPDQPSVSCGILEKAGINGNIPLDMCMLLPALVNENCVCHSNTPGVIPVTSSPTPLPSIDDDIVDGDDEISVECQDLAKDFESCMLNSFPAKCLDFEKLEDEFSCNQVPSACELSSCYGTCAESAKKILNCEANANGCSEKCDDESGTILTPSPTIHPSEPPSRYPSLQSSKHPKVDPTVTPSDTPSGFPSVQASKKPPTTSSKPDPAQTNISFDQINEVLCGDSTLMKVSVENIATITALVDGEMNSECALAAAALAICIKCNKCNNCGEKILQLDKGQKESCNEENELFKYCGCDVCQEQVQAMFDCQCSSANSSAKKLSFWVILSAIPLMFLLIF